MDEVEMEQARRAQERENAEQGVSATIDIAKELRRLRRMLRGELSAIGDELATIANRVTELPELLEEHTREVSRVADQLEKLRLSAARGPAESA